MADSEHPLQMPVTLLSVLCGGKHLDLRDMCLAVSIASGTCKLSDCLIINGLCTFATEIHSAIRIKHLPHIAKSCGNKSKRVCAQQSQVEITSWRSQTSVEEPMLLLLAGRTVYSISDLMSD